MIDYKVNSNSRPLLSGGQPEWAPLFARGEGPAFVAEFLRRPGCLLRQRPDFSRGALHESAQHAVHMALVAKAGLKRHIAERELWFLHQPAGILRAQTLQVFPRSYASTLAEESRHVHRMHAGGGGQIPDPQRVAEAVMHLFAQVKPYRSRPLNPLAFPLRDGRQH